MKILIRYIVLCILILRVNLFAEKSRNDYTIITMADDYFVVDFQPQGFCLDTLLINGRKYIKPDFFLASPSGSPGEPLLPVRSILIGIPQQGKVHLTILSSEYHEIDRTRILPVPELRKKGEFVQEVFLEGSFYSKSGIIPQKIAELIKPGLIRSQRVMTLKISPVQYNPVKGKIRVYDKIRLKIEFDTAMDQNYQKEDSDFKKIFSKCLINYAQAAKWRLSRSSKILKFRKSGNQIKCYKIPVYTEGIYSITGNFLKDKGIDISSIDPETIKIYNNGGRELPREIYAQRPDSLIENPVMTIGMDDNSFDDSDYFIFYGRGTKGWEYNSNKKKYEHYINIYSENNVYFFVFNDGIKGERILRKEPAAGSICDTLSSFRDRVFFEQDRYNPTEGGIRWYGHKFSSTENNKSYQLILNDPVADDTIGFRFRFKGGSSGSHQIQISLNQNHVKMINYYGSDLKTVSVDYTGLYENGANELSFQYSGNGEAYLDWYEAEYTHRLKASDGKLKFFSSETSCLWKYYLSGFSDEPLILDVTDISNIRKLEPGFDGVGWTFPDSSVKGNPCFYYAADESGFLTPTDIFEDQISDLRNQLNGADLLIVTHSDFMNQALRLEALRESSDSLSVFTADVQDVYDEFNSGLMDPVAIRDFVKYTYENWSKPPSILLLFGDGDYDCRNILSDSDDNWIPVFEYDGTTHNSARATDDLFTYVSGNDTYMDLSVGRIPVRNQGEAEAVIDKIVEYESNRNYGWWRTIFTVVGDDENSGSGVNDEIRHIQASEQFAENVVPDKYNLKKIYLTEYPSELTSGALTKPKAKSDLLEQINRGTVWVNFIGHGNRKVLTHEKLFERDRDIDNLENSGTPFFLYAATCHFGRYDLPDDQSGAELLVISEDKGAIAAVAASRECTPAANEALNRKFLHELLSTEPGLRLGEAMLLAKAGTYNTSNNEMYNIFGDPSMRLRVPEFRAVFTDVSPDTFRALGKVTVKGRIEKNGDAWKGYNGSLVIKCFDSKKKITYTTEEGSNLYYSLSGNSIFRGENKITDGSFQVSFMVPRDISYGGNSARISCYFFGENSDGCGFEKDIIVQGSSDLVDTESPELYIYFSGYEDFITGDMVGENPELIAAVEDDKSGINITEEIGHKLMLNIDDLAPINVSKYFQSDQNSFLSGKVRYPLNDLSEGEHKLSLKVWDNANNSVQKNIIFEIISYDELRIEQVLNYPNPMQNSTHFTFDLNQDAEITIKIFTVSGKLVRKLASLSGTAGFNMFLWDGTDEIGERIANGVYIYIITAKTVNAAENITSRVIEKLIIMR